MAAVQVRARSDGSAGPAGPTARDGARDAAGPAAGAVAELSRTPTKRSAASPPRLTGPTVGRRLVEGRRTRRPRSAS